ncbi:MAG: prepilin-type N-terminal cleavage/methylation domain-containing protein [Patescibacteria group bacterium]
MNNKAFTLIEFLIYIGIVGIILIVTGTIALNIFFGKAKLVAMEEVSQNARMAMEKIGERIRNAQSINSPPMGTSASSLSLLMADSQQNPTVFDLSNGILRMTENGGSAISLTSDEVIVTTLQFSNISYPNIPGTMRIQITMKYVNPENKSEYNVEKTFYTTANIRKK